jgi:hypothetical protein
MIYKVPLPIFKFAATDICPVQPAWALTTLHSQRCGNVPLEDATHRAEEWRLRPNRRIDSSTFADGPKPATLQTFKASML